MTDICATEQQHGKDSCIEQIRKTSVRTSDALKDA